jgi:hypothetical protein
MLLICPTPQAKALRHVGTTGKSGCGEATMSNGISRVPAATQLAFQKTGGGNSKRPKITVEEMGYKMLHELG